MKFSIWCVALMMITSHVNSQQNYPPALQLMKQMMDKYKQPASLSFEMDIRYYAETSPEQCLDSLKGSVKLSGDKYWCLLENRETVNTGDYMLEIFREEKLIHLAKNPAASNPEPLAVTGIGDQMILMLDSLSRLGLIELDMKEEGSYQSIIVKYKSHPSCRQVEYRVDKKSRLLDRTISIVKKEAMTEAEFQQTDKEIGYALIVTVFNHYSTEKPDPQLLQSSRYFQQKGKEYLPSLQYSDFNIIPDIQSR